MENIDYEQYLKVKRNKWNEEALINLGCRLKNIATIENILRKEGKHKEFMSSCFKQFTNFPQNSLFSAMIVHGVLLREITIDGATENELFISLGGKKARFGQREFCLVTGLRFGELSDIISTPYVAIADGIQKRYWPGEEGDKLKLSTVYERFLARNFKHPDDSLKMGLFLIANNVLFGQPLDKKVTNWLFNLVDDLDAFNSFAWGHYVFKMTMHYLRHGFRSRNSNKGHGKVRYRLYGFPWAVEVWAMEVVDTLIDGFGNRLQHTLPRMRRWTMYKRPRNCVKKISDLEANIRAGKVHVLEELKATDDEAGADYWVGVDFDISVGPQFIPLVEMKEKNELLDTEDDGDDGDDGGDVGDGSDRGDGDDGAPISKIPLKRKAPKQKKKASAKKQQRKKVPITSLAEEDPLPSLYSLGYTHTQPDNPLSIGFTLGYTYTLPEGMVDPPPPPHPPWSSFMQPPSPISSRQDPRSRGGDRINDLLEAVKALPDLLEGVVKREVSQLSGVLRGLMQEIQSTPPPPSPYSSPPADRSPTHRHSKRFDATPSASTSDLQELVRGIVVEEFVKLRTELYEFLRVQRDGDGTNHMAMEASTSDSVQTAPTKSFPTPPSQLQPHSAMQTDPTPSLPTPPATTAAAQLQPHPPMQTAPTPSLPTPSATTQTAITEAAQLQPFDRGIIGVLEANFVKPAAADDANQDEISHGQESFEYKEPQQDILPHGRIPKRIRTSLSMIQEQAALIDILVEERKHRDEVEEGLRETRREAYNTISELVEKVKQVEGRGR